MEEGNALVIVDVIVELLLISGMCPKVVCHVHEPWNFPLLMVTSSLGRKRPNCYEKMSQGKPYNSELSLPTMEFAVMMKSGRRRIKDVVVKKDLSINPSVLLAYAIIIRTNNFKHAWT